VANGDKPLRSTCLPAHPSWRLAPTRRYERRHLLASYTPSSLGCSTV